MRENPTSKQDDPSHFLARWWLYQKERFPLIAHGPLILAFSFCAVSFSARLRIDTWPDIMPVIVAFICCLLFFLQLRIADEFKDAKEDAMWRPYRAVPRGLVSLRGLGALFIACAIIQLCVSLMWSYSLSVILLIAWIYLAAMSFEFGARKWLKARPITYLWTHMMIMPIVDFFATATDWSPHSLVPPSGLLFFLLASFFNGIVIEIGRKIRTEDQEEQGVETYSRLWGPKKAASIWLALIYLTAACAAIAAIKVHAFTAVAFTLGGFALLITLLVIKFSIQLKPSQATLIEKLSALWTLFLYLSLGILPGVIHG